MSGFNSKRIYGLKYWLNPMLKLCKHLNSLQRGMIKNKSNHPISRNNHPSATANKAIHSRKRGNTKPTEHHIILTKYEAVDPTAVSKNNSSSGMLIS